METLLPKPDHRSIEPMETTKICCPQCCKTNRIPTARLQDGPKCGACKSPLFSNSVLELSQSNASKVLQNTGIPVLVDCWAPWCGPCRSFAPTFTKVAAEYQTKVLFAKLNTEQEQRLGQQWQISSIPTLILFQAGKEVIRMSGALPEPQLKAWINQNLPGLA